LHPNYFLISRNMPVTSSNIIDNRSIGLKQARFHVLIYRSRLLATSPPFARPTHRHRQWTYANQLAFDGKLATSPLPRELAPAWTNFHEHLNR
jgi:hypothetical protein